MKGYGAGDETMPSRSRRTIDPQRVRAGAFLKHERELAGVTQAEVAKALGFEYYTHVSAIENGRNRLGPEHYEAHARALKMDPREFVKQIMRFYDPETWKILFASEKAHGDKKCVAGG
jgi:transcriptional regulator with XRE-family HTH domain